MLLGRSRVYRLQPSTGTDSYGDPVEDWTAPDRKLLLGATATNRATEETETSASRVIEDEADLYARGAPGLTDSDRVEWRGEVWTIEGTPHVFEGIGTRPFTRAALRKVTGGKEIA